MNPIYACQISLSNTAMHHLRRLSYTEGDRKDAMHVRRESIAIGTEREEAA
jgi:hypothetical protein